MSETDPILVTDYYIVDFDGTIFKGDLLLLYLIYHFVFFHDKIYLAKIFLTPKRRTMSAIRGEIFSYLSEKYQINVLFMRFCRLSLVSPLVRSNLVRYLRKVNEPRTRIIVITANYTELVSCFFKQNIFRELENVEIFGTKLPGLSIGGASEIMRGRQKERKLLELIDRTDFDKFKIHNFFDSYDDQYLCKHATHNVIFTNIPSKRKFFRENFGAISFSDYVHKVTS